MNTILLFGAGKSSTVLIEYLGNCCNENNWKLLVCDSDLSLAQSKTRNYHCAEAISFDVSNEESRGEFIRKSDVVISMLPAALHFLVANDCVRLSRHLLTASYIDASIRSLQKDIEAKGLLFLGEMGLDPGIDHMSAMKMIHEIQEQNGRITSFKSHCGGLVSPESDDNPWHYKITWNPANIIMAGSAGAVYLEAGRIIEIPYSQIFNNNDNLVEVPGLGTLAWYPNRDSLSYIDTYQLHKTGTFLRTTLRYPSFCRGWNKIVQLDLTNKEDIKELKECNTFSDWFQLKKQKLAFKSKNDFKEDTFFNAEFLEQINFLSLESTEKIPAGTFSSALLLQYILETKLAMKDGDKDMIVMLHEIEYISGDQKKEIKSELIVKGDDPLHTAMAKTVGLPLGIAAKLLMENKIRLSGLHIPVIPEIYQPVLKELELSGIKFREQTRVI